MSNKTLGEVDLFGFDDFGVGHEILTGVAVGGVGSTVVGIAARYLSTNPMVLKYSDAIGGAAGVVAGFFLSKKPGYQEAGHVAMVTSVLVSGLRQLETLFGKKSGLSAPVIDYLNGGMGIPQVEYLNGGLGIPTIGPVAQSYGTIPGVAGPALSDGQVPVDVMQRGTLPGAGNDVTLLGAPQPHGMAQMYGATLFGSK